MPYQNIPALYTRTYTARELIVVSRALAIMAAMIEGLDEEDPSDLLLDLSVRMMPEAWET